MFIDVYYYKKGDYIMGNERRKKGSGSITRLADGTYRAKITVNGKTTTRRAKTLKDANQRLKELQNLVEKSKRQTTKNFAEISVAEYFQGFLDYKKINLKRTSYMRLESTIMAHIIEPFRYTYFHQLTTDDIQAYLVQARDEKGYHIRRLKRYMMLLKLASIMQSALKKTLILEIIRCWGCRCCLREALQIEIKDQGITPMRKKSASWQKPCVNIIPANTVINLELR